MGFPHTADFPPKQFPPRAVERNELTCGDETLALKQPYTLSPSLSLSPSLPLYLSPSLPLSLSPSLPLSLSPSLPLSLPNSLHCRPGQHQVRESLMMRCWKKWLLIYSTNYQRTLTLKRHFENTPQHTHRYILVQWNLTHTVHIEFLIS